MADLTPHLLGFFAAAAPASNSRLNVELWHWLALGGFLFFMLVFDLLVFHRQAKETTLRAAALTTFCWFLLAMGFNAIVFLKWGAVAASNFLSGYILEWSLSMDNVFVFAVIFTHFMVPKKYQYRVLFWGIMGAVVLRLLFVLAGDALIRRFSWIEVGFGLILLWTAIKLAAGGESEFDPEKDFTFRLARKFLRVAKGEHGDHFFAREEGKFCITPLFVVLLVIESSDVLFAIDSVPAIFGITKEPFIVFSSNMFAIMGLRALYFLLAGVMDMFRYLNYGLSAILGFVGIKMIMEYASHFEAVSSRLPEFFQRRVANHEPLLPPWLSLAVILSLLGISIVASLAAARKEEPEGPAPDSPAASPSDQVAKTPEDQEPA